MRIKRSGAEAFVVKVDESSGRVAIPQPLLAKVDWISGTNTIEAWLLLESPGRYRVVGAKDFETAEKFASARSLMSGAETEPPEQPLDFEDPEIVALPTRFLQTQIAPPPTTWRITIPKIAMALMHVNDANNTAVMLFSQGYLEVWSLYSLSSALQRPLKDVMQTT